jgi:CRP-like cAMP-binding protein
MTQTFDATAFLEKVGDGRSISRFKKGDNIFVQGDDASSLYFIQSGAVKLTVVSEQGKEAVIAIIEAGQFLGEACLSGHFVRTATASAMMDTVLTAIAKAAMLGALEKEPKLAELFLSHVLARSRRIEEDLIDQLFNSSERRLARTLLLLANFGKAGNPQPISVEISQATLAEMIGTTRSRVSYFMNKFRRLGFISYNGKIHVHSSLLNAVLHEKPSVKNDDEMG